MKGSYLRVRDAAAPSAPFLNEVMSPSETGIGREGIDGYTVSEGTEEASARILSQLDGYTQPATCELLPSLRS